MLTEFLDNLEMVLAMFLLKTKKKRSIIESVCMDMLMADG
jgi:hypothetical protein